MVKKVQLFLRSNSRWIPVVALLLVSAFLITSWFNEGFFYGGGDVGLPLYNPSKVLSILKDVWWGVHAPGFPYPQTLTSMPLYFVFSLIQLFELPPFILQAILFGVLLFISGLGMYLLFLEEVGKNKTLAFISALFYLLNPYMMIQIWHRFVHTAFFLSAFLPTLLWFFIRYQKTRNKKWVLAFLISSVLVSYMYGSLSFMITSWIPILFYILLNGISKGLTSFIQGLKDLFLFLVLWLVVHSWWLIPFWTTGPALLTQGNSLYESVSTLKAISEQSTVSNVLRGINPLYLYGSDTWVGGFSQPIMQFISWTGVFVGLIGVWRNLSRKNVLFWALVFVLSVFVSKGDSLPFGNLFLEGFSHSVLLGAFRNPFEKLGILIPFSLSPLFSLGVLEIYNFVKKRTKSRKLGYFVCCLLIFSFLGVYAWPMWLGKVFGNSTNAPYVEVPQEYVLANSWIVNQRKSGRVLHLPLPTGDAVTYKWKYGYNGVEPSQLIFDTPSISQGFGVPLLDSSLSSIVNAFKEGGNQEDSKRTLSNFNIRYILLHKDVDWKSRGLEDPLMLEKELNTFDFIEKKQEFGELVVYEVKENIFLPKIFTTKVGNVLTGNSKNFQFASQIFSTQTTSSLFLTPASSGGVDTNYSHSYSAVPLQLIDVPPIPFAYSENALEELPVFHYLPGSFVYPFIVLKEKISLFSKSILDRYKLELDYAGKRLVEASKLKELRKTTLYRNTLDAYGRTMDDVLSELGRRSAGKYINENGIPLRTTFERHRLVLVKLGETSLADKLEGRLSDLGLVPHFDLIEKDGLTKFNRRVFRFDLLGGKDYEILLRDPKARYLYTGGLDQIPFQIDNEVEVRKAQVKGDFLSFGEIFLDKGVHELSLNIADSTNLVSPLNSKDWVAFGDVKQFEEGKDMVSGISEEGGYATLGFSLKELNPGSTYKIDFDYWVKKGRGLTLQVLQDSDQYLNGKRDLDVDKLFDEDDYNHYWNNASYFFTTRQNARSFEIKFVAEPWNSCGSFLHGSPACKDKIVKVFNRPSEVFIKNISVKRVLTNEVLLVGTGDSGDSETKISQAVITKSTPSDYEGKIEMTGPTSFVFLETYHPEWRLSLTKDGKTIFASEDNHFIVNGYGNLWSINIDPGVYNFKVEFMPQKRFLLGVWISIVGGLTIFTFLMLDKQKK